jgi:hypothetical protein
MPFFSRENNVALVATLMLVFTGWAWGGVVLWTQWASFALGTLALFFALLPKDSKSPLVVSFWKDFAAAVVIAVIVAVAFATLDWSDLADQRASTLELLPKQALPPVEFDQWGLRGLMVGLGVMFAVIFIALFRLQTYASRRLLNFPPFWIGLALFTYIAIQSLNPWGLVVERDFIWRVLPQDPVSWLPAGLDAPFIGDNDPGGMNGWRQILIFSGPWMLLCALHIAVTRRRVLTKIAWVVGANALAIAIVGKVVASSTAREFLGFKPWFAHHAPFGPFVYRNHAGIYFYLAAALVLALTSHLISKKGERADRGGPHLISGFLFALLLIAAASTVSVGAMIGASMILCVAPALYFLDRNVHNSLSPVPALAILGCSLLLGYAVVSSTNLDKYRKRIELKQERMVQAGEDDRAPIRRATFAQLDAGDTIKVMYGWGAGSYRWTSPEYLAKQPEFVDSKGKLWARANFAHSDWLQVLLEWGIAGCAILVPALIWFGFRIRNAWRRRSGSLLALCAGVTLLRLHATIDFIFYFTPVLTLLALVLAWLALNEDADADHLEYGKSPQHR